jgi:hypothetical protein
MKYKIMNTSLKNQILALRQAGKKYDEIGSELNCSKGLVSYYCKSAGIGNMNPISDQERLDYQDLYDLGMSIKGIAEKFNRTRKSVSLYIDKSSKVKVIKDAAYFRDRRRKLKKMLVEHKGGCCSQCGYNKSMAALDFHHLDPNEKEFSIGRAYTKTLDSTLKELDKCIILCSNCHRELHEQED